MPRNARGGYRITGLGQYGKAPPRRKKKLDGRVYEDAQPWHPDTPRVRVSQAFLVPRAFLTGLHALSGHVRSLNWMSQSKVPYCAECNPDWH